MTNNKLLHVSAPGLLSSGCFLDQGNMSNTSIISVFNTYPLVYTTPQHDTPLPKEVVVRYLSLIAFYKVHFIVDIMIVTSLLHICNFSVILIQI